ncbi:hypothetical protein M1843_16435 [Isoptericola sp. 4D.3]|uniref:Uncharacterized protein n=1 Tax=Isoptericola peretonis TaxID=2918523 RepID=A0ABT0J7E4_9MICO|nr:hypothetical protein [Isoptericola sp. 4D.3]
MTTAQRPRRGLTVVLVATCAVAWLAALSGRIASSLASHDLLPQVAGWMVWPRGPVVYVRGFGAVLALGLLVWVVLRSARPWWIAAPVITLGMIAALAAPSVPYPGAHALFTAMRPQLVQIPLLTAVAGTEPATHDAALPRPLEPTAVHGYVSTDGAGGVFVPQWAGLVDDAGGFWFTPGTSPAGRDMWGMVCKEPTRLEGDWWVCGMDVQPGGRL